MGLPSAQRNQFDAKKLAEIQPLLDKFAYLPQVKKLADIVEVDYTVPGCPMDEKKFLEVLNTALKEFKIIE
jgi:coenzyme F420-reducing hydrogenase gamma subunit